LKASRDEDEHTGRASCGWYLVSLGGRTDGRIIGRGRVWVSISEETGGGLSAVSHDRSLELFCDRYEVVAHFVSLVNEDPSPRKILYLYGLGGNGKSLLLRYLAARCCVRLPPQEWGAGAAAACG
jgi:hypothetical protein